MTSIALLIPVSALASAGLTGLAEEGHWPHPLQLLATFGPVALAMLAVLVELLLLRGAKDAGHTDRD
jgi:hypothetical protein